MHHITNVVGYCVPFIERIFSNRNNGVLNHDSRRFEGIQNINDTENQPRYSLVQMENDNGHRTPSIKSIEGTNITVLQSVPDEIKHCQQQIFNELQNESGESYSYKGQKDYRFSIGALETSAKTFLQSLLDNKPDEQIAVLDIGTGKGEFLQEATALNDRVHATGLTASKFNSPCEPTDRILYYDHINAETLSGYSEIKQYDLICSAKTFMHLVDPLGTLSQAYHALKPGGFLLVDTFDTPGIDRPEDVLNSLKSKGIEVFYTTNTFTHKLENLIIKKPLSSHRDLPLPIEYSQTTPLKNNKAVYTLDQNIQSGPGHSEIQTLKDQLNNILNQLPNQVKTTFISTMGSEKKFHYNELSHFSYELANTYSGDSLNTIRENVKTATCLLDWIAAKEAKIISEGLERFGVKEYTASGGSSFIQVGNPLREITFKLADAGNIEQAEQIWSENKNKYVMSSFSNIL